MKKIDVWSGITPTEKDWRTIIPEGEENAIYLKSIAERMGVNTARAKYMIQHARRDGIEICSGQDGYFFARDEEELQRFADSMEQQAKERFKTIKSIKKKLRQDKNQMRIDTGSEGGKE